MIKTIAPPKRFPICAKAISSIRLAADNTATFPVPPIELLHNPAVMVDSTGYKPNKRPTNPEVSEIATTLVKHKTTNCQVNAEAKTFRFNSAIPIHARTAAVKFLTIRLLNIIAASS